MAKPDVCIVRLFSAHLYWGLIVLRTICGIDTLCVVVAIFASFCVSCGASGSSQQVNVVVEATRLVTGEALEGAELLFLDSSGAVATENFIVGPGGFVEVALSPGEYRAHLRAWRHDLLPALVGGALSFQAPSSGVETLSLSAALRAGLGSTGWVDVLVEDESGASVGGALVVAYSEEQCNASTGRSWGYADPEGRARITNLAAGVYTLKAYGRQMGPLFVGSTTVSAAGGNATPARVGVHGADLARVKGRITGELPAGSAFVSLHEPITGAMIPGTRLAVSGSDFEWTEIPSGRFLARIEVQGEQVTLSPENLKQNSAETIRSASSCTPNEVRVEGIPVHTVDSDFVEFSVPVVAAMQVVSPSDSQQIQAPPQMQWAFLPNSDFYVVEVRDSSGQTVYGGFALDGTPRMKVPSDVSALPYGDLSYANVDPSYIPNDGLTGGNRYSWRVYACRNDAAVAQGYRAIAVSSEGAGTFVYAPPVEE